MKRSKSSCSSRLFTFRRLKKLKFCPPFARPRILCIVSVYAKRDNLVFANVGNFNVEISYFVRRFSNFSKNLPLFNVDFLHSNPCQKIRRKYQRCYLIRRKKQRFHGRESYAIFMNILINQALDRRQKVLN